MRYDTCVHFSFELLITRTVILIMGPESQVTTVCDPRWLADERTVSKQEPRIYNETSPVVFNSSTLPHDIIQVF